MLLDSIIYFRRSRTALCHADQKMTRKGRTHYRRSTASWKIFCQWKDGPTSWTEISDIKELHPIETDEYAITQEIDAEPAFNWWEQNVIKRRAQNISFVKNRSAR